MIDPVRAADTPFAVEVEAGKNYFWCSCGKSASQPFCDGSHSETPFTPIKYEAEASKTVYFCGCKASKNAPLCDGSHSK
jgi:CDGSH-type Zn-finger protein